MVRSTTPFGNGQGQLCALLGLIGVVHPWIRFPQERPDMHAILSFRSSITFLASDGSGSLPSQLPGTGRTRAGRLTLGTESRSIDKTRRQTELHDTFPFPA